jgi:dynein heavy chain
LFAFQLGTGAGAKEKFLRLWTHEILRVFDDRLVEAEDCNWFLGVLKDTFKAHFDDHLDRVFRTLSGTPPFRPSV